jgi:hypothetical protein
MDIDTNTSFHDTLDELLASFDFSGSVYSLDGAQGTVLGWPTAKVNKWLEDNAITKDMRRMHGEDAHKYSKRHDELAHEMAAQCMASLERQVSCAESLRKLKQPLFEHCRRFFNAVARVEFTLPSPGGRDDDSEPVRHSMAKYDPLFKRVLDALEALLEETWKKVEMQTLAPPADPSTDKIRAHFLSEGGFPCEVPDIVKMLHTCVDDFKSRPKPATQSRWWKCLAVVPEGVPPSPEARAEEERLRSMQPSQLYREAQTRDGISEQQLAEAQDQEDREAMKDTYVKLLLQSAEQERLSRFLRFRHPHGFDDMEASFAERGVPLNPGWMLLKKRGSHMFTDFLNTLGDKNKYQIAQEVTAEAIRIWSVQFVQYKWARPIKQVDAALRSHVLDTASDSAPFVSTALFAKVDLISMAVKHMHGVPTDGPSELLRIGDQVLGREQKEAQLTTLQEIVRKFQATNLPGFGEYASVATKVMPQAERDHKFLELANWCLCQGSLGELGMRTEKGEALEWPQICVVGGQSEGKSTLLSSIVSAKLPSKLNFLPEGGGMVTKCAIVVQMRTVGYTTDMVAHGGSSSGGGDGGGDFDMFEPEPEPEPEPVSQPELEPAADSEYITPLPRLALFHSDHTAVVSTEGTPTSEHQIIRCGGRAKPSADDLKRFGDTVMDKIRTLQEELVAKSTSKVSREKIIVKFAGPLFPNLSLVDLPGLRAVDDAQEAGLKEDIKEMVKQTIESENAVVLAVCAQNPFLAPLSN